MTIEFGIRTTFRTCKQLAGFDEGLKRRKLGLACSNSQVKMESFFSSRTSSLFLSAMNGKVAMIDTRSVKKGEYNRTMRSDNLDNLGI